MGQQKEQDVSRHAVALPLEIVDFLFLGVEVSLLQLLAGLMVQHDEVAVLNAEAGQVVARVFRVEDVVIHNKCSADCGFGGAHANLADGAVFAEQLVHLVRGYFKR